MAMSQDFAKRFREFTVPEAIESAPPATAKTLASCRLGEHLLTGDSGRAGVVR
jgi:hypothetical protein